MVRKGGLAASCRRAAGKTGCFEIEARQGLNQAACRAFIASAPEVLLAIISTQSRIDFEGYGSTFESARCQKAVRRAARRNGVCVATPTEEPLAARRALHPLKPHNASHAQSPTG